MKILKILVIMLVLVMSVGAACTADAVLSDDAGMQSRNPTNCTIRQYLENTQNEVYVAGEASFTDLSNDVGNATGILNIDREYSG